MESFALSVCVSYSDGSVYIKRYSNTLNAQWLGYSIHFTIAEKQVH